MQMKRRDSHGKTAGYKMTGGLKGKKGVKYVGVMKKGSKGNSKGTGGY